MRITRQITVPAGTRAPIKALDYILTTTLNYSKVIVVAVAGVFPQLSQLVEKTQQKIKLKKSAWRWLLVNGNEIE
jgi:cobalamin biosynthesis Co2+ chelatase CbiK